MLDSYTTDRLILKELDLIESEFIAELVNTPQWIQFIGERNVKTPQEAINYVQKIIDAPNINYWVVKLKESLVSIGVVTFIKKEYLPDSDIGFAFLPQYAKKGYALEAVNVVLEAMLKQGKHKQILATTVKGNINSIRLLEKLGFALEREIIHENNLLLLYEISIDK